MRGPPKLLEGISRTFGSVGQREEVLPGRSHCSRKYFRGAAIVHAAGAPEGRVQNLWSLGLLEGRSEPG